MGLLVEGKWQDQWFDTKKTGGKFVRQDAGFRNWITADGSAGPSGEGGFKAEPDRYHLYISHACPWANRAAILRRLKGLEGIISESVVDHFMGDEGWTFDENDEGDDTRDPINGFSRAHQVYTAAKSDYTGRVTVPVLWDKERKTIVSNESSEIIRMLDHAFDAFTDVTSDHYPEDLREEIDAVNERVYHTVNNGVYKCGFASTQEAYEEAFHPLFDSLDWLEDLLGERKFLAGDRITEADWRLFTTLVRFDPVYVGHFKCNRQRIADYPNLSNYTRQLYQHDKVAETVNMDHIKRHYYASHESVNPSRVVSAGPQIDYTAPHNRGAIA
jgi:putative glutathione S-transferase